MQTNSTEDGIYHQYPISPFLVQAPILVPAGLAIGTVRYTTLSSAYAGSLVTPLVMLFLFCPKTFKRSIIFPILIINLFLGISLAFLVFNETMQSLHHPIQKLNVQLTLSITCLSMLIPILTDTVLVFKLLRLFPTFQYTIFQRIIIIAIPTALTVPRLVIMALFVQVHKQAITNSYSLLQGIIGILIKSRLPLIEFSMQLASNAYCSVILLIKAYTLLYGGRGGGGLHQIATDTETFRSELMMNKLRLMLRIMAGSFLLPVCVQIGLVCVYARSKDLNVREPIQWTNIFISLHCAVSATVWSSIGGDTNCGGGGESAEEQMTNNIKERSSSLFVPVIDHDKVGEMPNSQLMISKREIISERSASTINENDCVEIMSSPYLLTRQNSAIQSRSTEYQLQRPVYYRNLRAHHDPPREVHASHRLPQPWNENGRWDLRQA